MIEALAGKTAVVTGGSRGFGRGIAESLANAGMRVVVIARGKDDLEQLKREVDGDITTIVGDVTDPILAARVVTDEKPWVLVLSAGVQSVTRPTRLQTWDTFSVNFAADLKGVFLWVREAIIQPLQSGSTIFIGSSGAALRPVALNANYAAAKAAIWTFGKGVAEEAQALGIRVHCMLPVLSPATELGRAALKSFAQYSGQSEEEIIEQKQMRPFVTPVVMGSAIIEILTDPEKQEHISFRVTGNGATPIP